MASIIKTDNIQTTGGANIINQCSTTITLGASGDSVVLGAGVTATGFGRSGGVDYCTTVKTSPFTAANGSGYFVNTTCGAVTVTLPATPSAGAIIALKDYGNTWQTNNVTLCNNGSKINGVCATAKLSTQGQSVTLIYVDATKGWQDINDSTSSVTGNIYIVATGGTVTTCGDYKIHTFTSDGTFTVSSASSPTYANVDYLVVAGGGGGGAIRASGGGAGGFRESHCGTTSGCYTASPLASATSLPVTATTYPITVGGGGNGDTTGGWPGPFTVGSSGSPSIFSTITSAGGGKGSSAIADDKESGGSGGGSANGNAAGLGNTPPTSPPQGNNGGVGASSSPSYGAAGGGGATAVGGNGTNPGTAGAGGAGATTSISTSPTVYGGGGGGSFFTPSGTPGSGGAGGGGAGGAASGTGGVPGTVNTGGAGGGGWHPGPGTSEGGGNGGSGIVIIRYKFQ